MTLTVLLATAVWLADLAIKVAALGIIPGNRKPSVGMAWLILIFTIPVVGLVAFLLLGRARLERKRQQVQGEATERVRRRTADVAPWQDATPGRAFLTSVTHLNRELGAFPAQPGNDLQLLPDYAGSIAAMTDAVREATTFVHVEFYITAWDSMTGPFFEELVAAQERGVRVRLLLDHLGSRGIPGYRDLTRRLDAAGIAWHPMMPIQPFKGRMRRPDLRNHRKILVVDGRVAFTGSQNLVEPGYDKPKNHRLGREWVDLAVRVRGPVVAALHAVFAIDWYAETGEILGEEIETTDRHAAAAASPDGATCQLVPSGPGNPAENNLRLFNTLLYSAQRRISLTSPYFVPDESLLYAVTTAAQRGVEVELFVSEQADQFMVHHAQCSYYQALLAAGVRIWLYPSPAVLHSKHLSIDDEVGVIGSSNMDMRSFALNYEVSLLVIGRTAVDELRRVEDGYRALSRELTVEEWSQRSRGARYVDNVMRLTAALQ